MPPAATNRLWWEQTLSAVPERRRCGDSEVSPTTASLMVATAVARSHRCRCHALCQPSLSHLGLIQDPFWHLDSGSHADAPNASSAWHRHRQLNRLREEEEGNSARGRASPYVEHLSEHPWRRQRAATTPSWFRFPIGNPLPASAAANIC